MAQTKSMYVLFQVQWVVAILLTCYTLAHAAPKRARSVPTREVHARRGLVEQSEHGCYGDLNASFKAWQGRSKKRRNAEMNSKVSVMARYLLEAWGFGVKSAHEVQREAAMAVADGADHPDLVTLAGLGTASHDADMGYMRPKNPGNIERDLRVAVKRMTKGKIVNLPNGEHDVARASVHGAKPRLSHSYVHGLVDPYCVPSSFRGQHEPWI